jgi:hypothetical protein
MSKSTLEEDAQAQNSDYNQNIIPRPSLRSLPILYKQTLMMLELLDDSTV